MDIKKVFASSLFVSALIIGQMTSLVSESFNSHHLYAEEENKVVTLETQCDLLTNYSYSATCYINSLEELSALSISVYYDESIMEVTGYYNNGSYGYYDASNNNSAVNFAYLFTGTLPEGKTSLFYFYYHIKQNAPEGRYFFDVVINEAYDSSLSSVPVSGSRKYFNVTAPVSQKSTSFWGLNPNLVQTLEGNPAVIHGGPFANIAHGCNSIIATKMALKLAPVVVTEAGFGADLGAEKFLDIKCRVAGLKPDAVVVVATIRALKMHGGQPFEELANENVEALANGVCNLKKHIENVEKYGVPAVVCINHFASDTEAETAFLSKWCEDNGYDHAYCSAFADGAKGGAELAKAVMNILNTKKSNYHPLYDVNLSIKEKIEIIAKEIYGAGQVVYTEDAEKQIADYTALGFDKTPICIAKTPQSLTDDPKVLGAPKDLLSLSKKSDYQLVLTSSFH